jgi:hypothetical protein
MSALVRMDGRLFTREAVLQAMFAAGCPGWAADLYVAEFADDDKDWIDFPSKRTGRMRQKRQNARGEWKYRDKPEGSSSGKQPNLKHLAAPYKLDDPNDRNVLADLLTDHGHDAEQVALLRDPTQKVKVWGQSIVKDRKAIRAQKAQEELAVIQAVQQQLIQNQQGISSQQPSPQIVPTQQPAIPPDPVGVGEWRALPPGLRFTTEDGDTYRTNSHYFVQVVSTSPDGTRANVRVHSGHNVDISQINGVPIKNLARLKKSPPPEHDDFDDWSIFDPLSWIRVG